MDAQKQRVSRMQKEIPYFFRSTAASSTFPDASFFLPFPPSRQFRQILGDVPFDTPEVSDYIREYLNENKLDTDGGVSY